MSVYLRNLAATFIGLFLAAALIVAVEGFSTVVRPLPSDFGGTMEEMCRHVEDTRSGCWPLSFPCGPSRHWSG